MGGSDYRKFQLPDELAKVLERCLYLAGVVNRLEGIGSPTAASRRMDAWEQLLATAERELLPGLHAALPSELAEFELLEAAGWRCGCGHSKGVGYDPVSGAVRCGRCRGANLGRPAGDRGPTAPETREETGL